MKATHPALIYKTVHFPGLVQV